MKTSYDYRNTIHSEFERRTQRNPRYTLRSFARDLKISVSSLSLILAGKQGISLSTATSIGFLLRLDDKETELFLTSVKSLHSRTPRDRSQSKKALESLLKKYQETILKYKTFQEISRWQFFAIAEYLRSHPKTKPEVLAKSLRFPLPVVREALSKLQTVGVLVKQNKEWKVQAEIMMIMSDVPSRAIRDFHQGVLSRAAEAIEKQSMKERTLASTFFAFDPGKFSEIQDKIKEFRLSLIREYSIESENAEVYCLSQQLFQLSNFEEAENL